MSPSDPFLGLWRFDPAQARYQLGEPPQIGTYRLDAHGDGYLITMEWTDARGQSYRQTYTAIPDGQLYPYGGANALVSIAMTRLDDRTLDTASFRGGERIAYAVRRLSDDGQTMQVIQSGQTPEGTPFENIAVYVRQP